MSLCVHTTLSSSLSGNICCIFKCGLHVFSFICNLFVFSYLLVERVNKRALWVSHELSTLFSFLNFYWRIVALQLCICFCCTNYVYIDLLFFGFPSHLGHQRTLTRGSLATHSRFSLVISLYIAVYICQSQPPNSSHPLLSPLVSIR